MWPRLTNRANPRVDSGAGSDHTGAASEVVTSSACTYAIRFILPDLSLADLKAVGEDRLSLDERTREYIRSRFTYRYALTDDGDTALAIASEVQGGALSIGKPFLNPR